MAGAVPATSGPVGDAVERIEERIRGELAALVGAGPSAGWREIGDKLEDRIRGEVAELAGEKPQASWGEIGERMEGRVKATLGGWAGVTPGEENLEKTIKRTK